MTETNKTCARAGCPFMLNRRSFLAGAGALAAAANTGLFEFASSLFAAEPRTSGKPVVSVVFVRPNVKGYWMGWPGAAYDIGERQRHYTQVLNSAAGKFSVQLDLRPEPLADENAVNTCLAQLKSQPPNGLVVVSMSLNQSWPHINKIAKERGKIPTIVFSPMGTSFTSHLQDTRDIPGVYVAATQDIEWLNFGIRMLRTIWDMEHTRMCIVQGDKAQDSKLDVIGTTLHYVPRRRYPEEFRKVEDSDEVRALADFYTKQAQKIVEPTQRDIMNSVKNYVVAKRIMAAENCQIGRAHV